MRRLWLVALLLLLGAGGGAKNQASNDESYISNLAPTLWIDVSGSALPVTPIATLTSKVAGRTFTQATAGDKPVLVLEAGANRWAADFASSDKMQSASTVADLIDATDWTAFVVYNTDALAGDGPLISEDTANTWTLQLNSDEDFVAMSGTGTAVAAGTAGLHLATAIYDHTALGASVDGGTVVWGAGTSPTLTNVVNLGTDGTDYLDGRIREVLVFDKALYGKQIERIQKYLAAKHGITMAAANSDWDRCQQFFLSKTPTMHLSADSMEVGPVRFFTLDDSAASTAIVDKVGNANGVLNVNSDTIDVAAGSCKAGTCLDFYTGSADHIITVGSDVFGSTNASVCAWAYPHTAGEGSFGRIYRNDGNIQGGINSTAWEFTCDGTNLVNAGASTVALNTWQYVCFVRSGTTGQIYKNGVATGSSGSTGTCTAGADSTIGCRSTGAYCFDGLLDEVRIYNYALTANQVLALYNGGTAHQFFSTVGPSLTQAAPVVLDDGGSLVLAWQGKFNATPVEFSQTTDTIKPSWSSGGVDFELDTTPDVLTSATTLDGLFNNNAKTFIAVAKTESVAANGDFFGDNNRYILQFRSTGPVFKANNYDTGWDVPTGVSTAAATTYVIISTHDGVNITGQLNGGTVDSVASGNTGTMANTMRISSPTDAYDGLIMEILTDDSVWTAAELAQSRRCLGNKYGVSY